MRRDGSSITEDRRHYYFSVTEIACLTPVPVLTFILHANYRGIHGKSSGDVVSAVCYILFTIYLHIPHHTNSWDDISRAHLYYRQTTGEFTKRVREMSSQLPVTLYSLSIYTSSYKQLRRHLPCTFILQVIYRRIHGKSSGDDVSAIGYNLEIHLCTQTAETTSTETLKFD